MRILLPRSLRRMLFLPMYWLIRPRLTLPSTLVYSQHPRSTSQRETSHLTLWKTTMPMCRKANSSLFKHRLRKARRGQFRRYRQSYQKVCCQMTLSRSRSKSQCLNRNRQTSRLRTMCLVRPTSRLDLENDPKRRKSEDRDHVLLAMQKASQQNVLRRRKTLRLILPIHSLPLPSLR